MPGGYGCGKCGREFATLMAFDRHHRLAYGTPHPVTCVDPATLGMITDQHGRWTRPMSSRERERLSALPKAAKQDDPNPPIVQ